MIPYECHVAGQQNLKTSSEAVPKRTQHLRTPILRTASWVFRANQRGYGRVARIRFDSRGGAEDDDIPPESLRIATRACFTPKKTPSRFTRMTSMTAPRGTRVT